LRPDDGRYGYTYAFYLFQEGAVEQAVTVLADMIGRNVPYSDAYMLLADIYLKKGELQKAADVYSSGYRNTKFTQQERDNFRAAEFRLKQGP
jgi:cytochrome c-type biogenesis protein CcmH/NrfG